MKRIFLIATLFFPLISIFADDYVAIAKDGKVYDQANAKYITENQSGDEVNVLPGMVFKTSEHVPGWYKVEYSPGLHAFVPEPIVATAFLAPAAGEYVIANNPGVKISVASNDGNWTASAKGKNYKGIQNENILLFVDENNAVAYSLVDLGNGPIAITYDNAVTKFF